VAASLCHVGPWAWIAVGIAHGCMISVTTRPSRTLSSVRPRSDNVVGRTSVWSVQTSLTCPAALTPGPTYPTQVEAISSWMSPWFQAKLWGVRAGMDAHDAGVGQTPPDVEKKNQSGSANNVKVGVRNGSAVTMWRVASSTG